MFQLCQGQLTEEKTKKILFTWLMLWLLLVNKKKKRGKVLGNDLRSPNFSAHHGPSLFNYLAVYNVPLVMLFWQKRKKLIRRTPGLLWFFPEKNLVSLPNFRVHHLCNIIHPSRFTVLEIHYKKKRRNFCQNTSELILTLEIIFQISTSIPNTVQTK